MTLQIRTKLMLVIITLVSTSLFANDGRSAPFTKTSSATFLKSVKKFDAEFNVLKVCACQILKAKSNNENLENIAVFSEKINNGDLSADFSVATEVLEKEKKQMKFFFYDKITVVNKIVVATDCKTLYKQLKAENDDLKMYELLDADIKSRFYNLNK